MNEDRILYNGWHKVESIQHNGQNYEKLHIKSAVAGIVTDLTGSIALVEQFRPALNTYTYEIPAGVIDKPISNQDILYEELAEECYIASEDIISCQSALIPSYDMIGGSSDAVLHLYRVHANIVGQDMPIEDDTDVIRIMWVSLDELKLMIMNGKIKDAKTIMASFLLNNEQGGFYA